MQHFDEMEGHTHIAARISKVQVFPLLREGSLSFKDLVFGFSVVVVRVQVFTNDFKAAERLLTKLIPVM